MKVNVIDDLNPEDNAMVQALYSRSPAPVEDHLKKVQDTGSGKFMSRFYVDYGHESIGNCGTTTIFIEGVSMIAAKEIQNHPLYNGQESSTRFIDFGGQDVIKNGQSTSHYMYACMWADLYIHYLPLVKIAISKKTGKDEKSNAVKTQAFDLMRGFLPCAAATNLSWTTSLSNARDVLKGLMHSESDEVVGIARSIHMQLLSKYPNSFDENDLDIERNPSSFMYFDTEEPVEVSDSVLASVSAFDTKSAKSYLKTKPVFVDRKQGEWLPRETDLLGRINFVCSLDFASYRDIQRHRNGYCSLPIVKEHNDIHPHYTDNVFNLLADYISADCANDFMANVDQLLHSANDLHSTGTRFLYAMPMGLVVDFVLGYGLRQCVYVSELRSGPAVHQTLRELARDMGHFVEDLLDVKLYLSETETDYVRRGKQTITEK